MNILVLNGPSLNLLGEREPAIYGTATLRDVERMMKEEAAKHATSLHFLQSNHEGILIDKLHEERHWADGIVMNPGALTHYSYALRDAVAAINKPMVEVHLTDLMKREEFRKFSVFEGATNVRRIMGRGARGYVDALIMLITPDTIQPA
jgi:3-dehydroquinate dehydratase-2